MLEKRAFLIERALTPVEEEGFLAILKQADTKVYLAVENQLLYERGAVQCSKLSASDKVQINENLLASLNRFGHALAAKDTVAGLLAYKGFPTFYYHKFRIVHALQPQFYRLALYRQLLEQHQQLVVYAQTALPDALKELVPALQFVLNKPHAVPASVKQKTGILEQLKKTGVRFAAGMKYAFQQKGSYPSHVFVLDSGHIRTLLDPEHLPQTYQDNGFVSYFLNEWSGHFLLIDKLLIEKSAEAANPWPQQEAAYWRRPMLPNDWIEDKALMNPLMFLKIRRFHKHLKKAYHRIGKKLKDPLQKQLLMEYKSLHRSSLYFYFVYLAYRQFFRSHKFTSVTLLDEYSPNFRAIFDAAKQEGVRRQAIQHGALAATNPGYSYSKEDERFDPWPDLTLVWGEYWKQLLIDIAAYPPDRLQVSGQIRTDIIPKLMNTPLDADKILGSQTAGKFLILFATQPLPDESLRQQAALDVFKVAQEMPDAWVVVKPHPREENAYYAALAEQAGCSNYSIHAKADLFLLLRLCHVLVHCYSTVGIEAVYFGLPAIILDYLNQDLLKFAAEEVALQAMDATALKQQLIAVQSGAYKLDKIKQQAYIRKYACAVDGKVSKRTAEALLQE